MKYISKLLILCVLLSLCSLKGFSGRTYDQHYYSGKTYATLTISSTTVTKAINRMQFDCVGTYGIITSSIAVNASQEWYILNGVHGDSGEFVEPSLLKDTDNIIITPQSGTTIYYWIGVVDTAD